MKELIGKLSRGIVENNFAKAESLVTSIEEKVEEGSVFHGSFEVFNEKNGALKGIVYSTTEYLKILNNQFIGEKNIIKYEVNTKGFRSGESIIGRINIVSNGGEFFIPYNIAIEEKGIPSAIGNICNIFQFMNLVKDDYDEAVKIFSSSEFKKIILKDNAADICMYNGLIKSNNKKIALEEFIIAINKKQKVEFFISDTEREYDSLDESYGDIILLSRSTWGTLNIEVDVEGDFIREYRHNISNEDFAGNNYEFSYLIDVDKLHSGMNYGKIIFKSINNRYECKISVDNIKEHNLSKNEVKKCIVGLNKIYLDFRMRKCRLDKWIDESIALIDRARSFNDDNLFLRLLQAQILLSKKNDTEAEWILDGVAEEILDKKESNIPLYCYYLYVRTLQKRELEYTLMTTEIINKYYENGYDKWELLWILMYTDTSFENNKSLKIARIKEQFRLGCRSTLMYYEALYSFNKQPALMRVINDFELQVINFGSKYDAVDLRLAVQISELALLEKTFRPMLFKVLVNLYKKFENKLILTAILSLLIRGNKTSKEYFKWYELGIYADIQVTRLFEYYVFSMPEDYMAEIPDTVLMYYVYNGNLLNDKEAFYYSIIIKNKDKYPNIYKNYVKNIEKFALESVRKGEIDEYLAVIYEDVLKTSMINEDNEKNLPSILNTWVVELDNDYIREVIILHKEIKDGKVYKVIKNRAYVNIYTEDVIILFRDVNNNIYMNSVNYTIKKLFDNKELSDIAMVRNTNNIYVMANECEQLLRYQKHIKNGIALFSEIMSSDKFNEEYKDCIINDIIGYYIDNYDGDELDNFLVDIKLEKLSKKSRISIVELMITRGLYKEARLYFEKYGIAGIDAKKILKFCTYFLRFDKEKPNKFLEYCNEAFKKGKYNEESLEYLCENYNGTTKEMMELWRISKEFSMESRELEERIIAQMLFTRTSISSISTIYESYYKKGALQLIKKAYLFYEAYVYFVNEQPIDDLYFLHLEDELIYDDSVHDICKCAYLLKNSYKNELDKKTKAICKEALEYLNNQGIVFDFYKKFDKYFKLAGNIMDRTTIVYRTENVDKVMINYYIETGNLKQKEYILEEMKQIFPGMYVKSFILFYGEKINYYVMEVKEEEKVLTESREYIIDDRSIEVNASRYGRLNDIFICRELKDENTVNNLAKDYYVYNELTKRLFGSI